MIRIGLDMDEVLDDFMGAYIKRYGITPSNVITKNVRKLSKDKDFWMNLTKLRNIDFIPELYCSKRIIPKSWSKEWLKNNGFPIRPFYQLYCQHDNKARLIKGRVDVFVDDSISNFKGLNKAGVPCLLMDCPYNQGYETPLRLFSLTRGEIENLYYKECLKK